MSVEAGKVYFVLYLAVVLELLIIIVERDEAEESLRRKQKETMRIVESILSQLQTGSGTEAINTRPQDEITIPPKGVDLKEIIGADIKPYRRYIVEVGVTDVSSAIKKQEGETEKEYVQKLRKLVELGNVEEIEYQIFYSDSDNPDNAPQFPTQDQIRGQGFSFTDWQPGDLVQVPNNPEAEWEFLGLRKLRLDKEETFNNIDLQNITVKSLQPVYPEEDILVIGPSFAPKEITEDSIFFYSQKASFEAYEEAKNLQKRSFIVNFRPPDRAGWYKLRFSSRTNRILGVRGDKAIEELDDETTVNIGTVQLTVEDLKKVKKELEFNLSEFDLPDFQEFARTGDYTGFDNKLGEAIDESSTREDALDLRSKLQLYGYIAKLLAPGMSVHFEQNQGAIEFNIRVIKPEVPISEPVVKIPDYNAGFNEVPSVFEFTISPYQGENANIISGRVLDINGQTVSRIDCRPLDQIADLEVEVAPPTQGGRREYRGYVMEELPPGKYTVEITHKLTRRQKIETGTLEIFETTLTEESGQKITGRLSAFAYYGYNLSIDATPTSGGKIKSNQFRIYLYTDNQEGQQGNYISGLSVSREEALELNPEADKVTCRVTWIQPYTGKEIDLYPAQTFDVKQEEPTVSARNMVTDVNCTGTKVKIALTNISVSTPLAGADITADIEVELGQADKAQGLNTYSISVQPTIDGDPETGYNVFFEMDGKLPRGEDKIRGIVTVPVKAKAINPVNYKESEWSTQVINVNINCEPERGRTRGRERRR